MTRVGCGGRIAPHDRGDDEPIPDRIYEREIERRAEGVGDDG